MTEQKEIADVVLDTPEPDKWIDCGESRPLPMFHMHTLMQYGERCAEAALAWLRSQGEPMFWVRLTSDGGYEGPIHNDRIERVRKLSGAWHPLFLAPQPAIPDGWLDRGKAALAECRAADDLWSDDRLLSHLFNAMTAATQPVVHGGWKLVPMEPTPTMLSAGAEGSGEFIEHARFVWTQMLAAAPEPSK